MKKPSIFSSKYQETLKKRRRRNVLLGLLIICIIFTIFAIFNDRVNDFWASINQKPVNSLGPDEEDNNIKINISDNTLNTQGEQNTTNKIIINNEVTNSTNNITGNSTKNEKKEEKKFYTLKLASERDIKIYYEDKNQNKVFTGETDNGDYISLSPSKKKAVIIDKTNQDMYITNIDNTFINITKDVYTAYGRSDEKYYKSDQLARFNNNYLWHDSAKFVSEDKIVYRSRLPYFIENDLKLYLWSYDIPRNVHECIFAVTPGELQIRDLDQNGINISVSGVNYYFKPDGTIINR